MWILGLKGLSSCFKEKFDIVTARSKRVLTVACRAEDIILYYLVLLF